jgi:transcriptional regulator with XRE-family HTH domain
MASLSERLKRERELRGISLKQISEETRIGVRFLEALEADRLDVIPGEFYRRSYLRAYARYLGLDEDRALNVYDYSRKDKSTEGETESGTGAAPTHGERNLTGLPSWLKWVGASLGLGLALVLLLRAMPASTEVTPPAPIAASEREAPPIHEPAAAAAIDLQPSPFPAETVLLDKNLRLVLSVEESCWLEIAADGEVVVSGLKEQGFREEITASRELRLWVGNAGGVKLILNDRPAIPLGRPGQVRKDLTITLDNYRDFVSSGDRS